jgi:hypothetical protein
METTTESAPLVGSVEDTPEGQVVLLPGNICLPLGPINVRPVGDGLLLEVPRQAKRMGDLLAEAFDRLPIGDGEADFDRPPQG